MTTSMELTITRDGQPVVTLSVEGEDAVVSAILGTASTEQDNARHRVRTNGHTTAAEVAAVGTLAMLSGARLPDLEAVRHTHTEEHLADGSVICADTDCGEVLSVDEEAPVRG